MSHLLDGLLEHVREGREHTKNPEDAAVQSFFEARTELHVAMQYAGLASVADYLLTSEVYNARFCAWGVVDGATFILAQSFGPTWELVSDDCPEDQYVTSVTFGGTTLMMDNEAHRFDEQPRIIALTTSMRDDNAARDGLARQRGELK